MLLACVLCVRAVRAASVAVRDVDVLPGMLLALGPFGDVARAHVSPLLPLLLVPAHSSLPLPVTLQRRMLACCNEAALHAGRCQPLSQTVRALLGDLPRNASADAAANVYVVVANCAPASAAARVTVAFSLVPAPWGHLGAYWFACALALVAAECAALLAAAVYGVLCALRFRHLSAVHAVTLAALLVAAAQAHGWALVLLRVNARADAPDPATLAMLAACSAGAGAVLRAAALVATGGLHVSCHGGARSCYGGLHGWGARLAVVGVGLMATAACDVLAALGASPVAAAALAVAALAAHVAYCALLFAPPLSGAQRTLSWTLCVLWAAMWPARYAALFVPGLAVWPLIAAAAPWACVAAALTCVPRPDTARDAIHHDDVDDVVSDGVALTATRVWKRPSAPPAATAAVKQ